MFDRITSLVGEDKFKLFQKQKILIIGIGGVGGYVLEALVRTGFTNITIVDYDNIDKSNLNRQIITNINNIGRSKVEEAKKRSLSINDSVTLNVINLRVNEENIEDILNNSYDYVIDACDTVIVKFMLMKLRNKYDYKLISSMGTAKKLDSTKLCITTLDKTSYDPLAKKLRYMLRKDNVRGKFIVVSSTEEAKGDCNILGSIVCVPAVAGFYLASYVINDVIKN